MSDTLSKIGTRCGFIIGIATIAGVFINDLPVQMATASCGLLVILYSFNELIEEKKKLGVG